jgi:hypothetical protein
MPGHAFARFPVIRQPGKVLLSPVSGQKQWFPGKTAVASGLDFPFFLTMIFFLAMILTTLPAVIFVRQ